MISPVSAGQGVLRQDSVQPEKVSAVLSQRHKDHVVLFSSSDEELAGTVSEYLLDPLRHGGTGISIATPVHRQLIDERLARAGVDPAAAVASGGYVELDAEQTLARFMVNGWPDPAAFYATMSPVLKRAARRRRRPVRAFGEMVSLLWESGQYTAAIDLETLWAELTRQHRFALLCAYPAAQAGSTEDDELVLILAEHDRVIGRTGPAQPDAMPA